MSTTATPTEPASTLVWIAAEIRAEVEAADGEWQSALGHAIKAGELLIEAKAACKHGRWLPWLGENFEFTVQTANGYMRAARNREQIEGNPSISTLGGALKLLAPTRQNAQLPAAVDDIEDARWKVWRADWMAVSGEDPLPLPCDMADAPPGLFRRMLTELIASDEAGDLEQALHAEMVLNDAARVVLFTSKTPPAPPSWKPGSRANVSNRAQMAGAEWEIRVAHRSGEMLIEADHLGLSGGPWPPSLDPDDVNVSGARRVLRGEHWAKRDGVPLCEAGVKFDAEWSDDDIRDWAIGHVAGMVPRSVTALLGLPAGDDRDDSEE